MFVLHANSAWVSTMLLICYSICLYLPEQSKDTAVADMMAAAIKHGSKEWRRSKLSFVGEGRAGKTAVTNSVIGRVFEQTASTVGINQLTCDVKQIKTGGAQGQDQLWAECVRQWPEWESAIAEMVAASKHKKADTAVEPGTDIRAYMATLTSAAARAVTADPDVEEGVAGTDVQENVAATTVTEHSRDVTATHPPPPNIASAEVTQVKQHTLATASSAHVSNLPYVAPSAVETKAAVLQQQADELTDERVLDEAAVMKMLATMEDAETGMLISLFDFGGQSVFDVIHHLFLTRNGVYALVFNMEWLVKEGPEKNKALRFMRNWLSSIAVHTYNADSKMTAPIVIVGSRLDKITSPADHEKISTILHEHFCDNLAWRSVISNKEGRDSNGKALQWFFPVDNTLGVSCNGMKRLMSVVYGVIDKAAYTHKQVPLTWLKVIDQMADSKKDCLLLSNLTSLCRRNGVSTQELPCMLTFLHDVGHLMWLDEPGLCDVVVLDPVSYFVTPATIIICKLTPDHDDTTHHLMECHSECERLHRREWIQLKRDGVLHSSLLSVLWRDYAAHREVLLQLMVKFGLLVPLHTADAVTQYLVPTLLPPASLLDPIVSQWTDQRSSRCYLVFTLAEDLEQSTTLTEADLRSAGFLPGGMFERIVGKALSWSQDTVRGSSINLQSVLLHKDVVVLAFGRQRFRLVHCPDLHCVRVDIEGDNPIGIQQKLLDFACKIIDECMRSLCCFVAVCIATSAVAHTEKTIKELLPSDLLIPLEQLRKAGKGESMLTRRGGRTLMSLPEIRSSYGQWLQLFELRDRYDVFISYRWGTHDSAFTERLFDMFSNYSMGASNRAVEVFLDRKRLREGRQFKSDFASALTHCAVALPMVSVDALECMVNHNPANCDNVLLEWIIILECFAVKRLQQVFPILFGEREASGLQNNEVIVRNFFAHPIKDQLPHVSPTTTLSQAAALLCENGMTPSEKFSTCTVNSVVHDLLLFLLCQASDIPGAQMVEAVADRVVGLLADCKEVVHESPDHAPVVSLSPLPAPVSSTVKALADLTVPEVCVLLEKVNLSNLVEVFTTKKVSGMMLSFCETSIDLQGEEIGVTSALVARGLIKLVVEWKERGVCL